MVHVRAGQTEGTCIAHHQQIAALRAAATAGPVFQRRDNDQVARAAPAGLADTIEGGDLEWTAHASIVPPPQLARRATLRLFRRPTDRNRISPTHRPRQRSRCHRQPCLQARLSAVATASSSPPKGIPAARFANAPASRHTVAPNGASYTRIRPTCVSTTVNWKLRLRALPYGFRRVLVLRPGQGCRRRRPHVAARPTSRLTSLPSATLTGVAPRLAR